MNKLLCLLCMAIMTVSVFFLSGCKKSLDRDQLRYNIKQFGIAGTPLGTMHNQSDTIVFTYNASNDPVTGIRVHVSTGFPNFFFRYDRQGRFTDLIGTYKDKDDNTGVESWTRYFYDARGRIARDSFYSFPYIVNGQPVLGELSGTIVSTYDYDSKDRVSKVTRGTMVTTYSYDAQGNLAGAAHDNKINFRQTNKIWMFIDRDYSVNNTGAASYTYNSNGLPTKIIPFAGTFGTFMSVAETSFEFSAANVEYVRQ